MRDFFINGFEILLGIILILMAIAVVAFAGVAAFGGGGNSVMMNGQPMSGGPMVGGVILIVGLIYVLFVGGLMYLGLGIYQNTKRTAAAMERMAGK